ncbi:flippase [Cobetia amphilecti]|uniref:flippase n=1 Tax=Cobetia amphilecti TaxID=1055104 RepID=UPI003299AE75
MPIVTSFLKLCNYVCSSSIVKKNIVAGGFLSLLVKTGSTLLGFISVVILARTLGAEDYGIYTFVISVVTLIALPTQLGLPQLIVRESAKYYDKKDYPSLKSLWKWSTKLIAVTSLLVFAIAIISYSFFNDSFEDDFLEPLLLATILIPIIALSNVRGAALRGLGHTIMGQFPESIIRPSCLTLFAGLSFLITDQLTVYDAVKIHIFAAIIGYFVGGWILYINKPSKLSVVKSSRSRNREWIMSALPLAIISGLQLINNQSDIIMLTLYRSPEEVGVYKVVSSICTLVIFGFMAVQIVLSPKIAILYSNGDVKALNDLIKVGTRTIIIIALPVFFVLVVFGEWILETTFGSEYVSGYLPLMILSVGRLINAAFGLTTVLLNMTSNEKINMRIVMLSAALNILLNFIFIPLMGMSGAAITTVVTLAIWNISSWFAVKKKLKIKVSPF